MSHPLTVAALYAERKAKQEAAMRQAEQAREEEERLKDEAHLAFLSRKFTDADAGDIERRIRNAFRWREREAQIFDFPSDYCPDGGRRINHALPGWEDQLVGFAGEIHRYWERALKPGGFGFNARIINFRDDMPGDIGLFITWPDELAFEFEN